MRNDSKKTILILHSLCIMNCELKNVSRETFFKFIRLIFNKFSGKS